MSLLRTFALSVVLLALLIWGFSSSPFADHQEVASSEREPAVRDNFYDVAARDECAWIVGYHGTILRSQDRGVSWQIQQSGTSEPLFRISLVSPDEAWISGAYGTILHTTNGGKSWQKQQTGTEEHLFGIHFIDERRGWAVGSRGTVLSTTDGGTTWVSHSIDGDIILNDVRLVDGQRGWVVGEFGRIYHTRDGGLHWEKQNSPVEVAFTSGASRNLFRLISNGQELWSFGLDGVILTSKDGVKWTTVATADPSPAAEKRYHLFSASSVGAKEWAVGERGTILVSSRDGNWHESGAKQLPANLNGIAFGSDGTGLIVGNRGTLLRSDDAGAHWAPLKIAIANTTSGVN
jgi:photosystem II stability/assembly factor-like uncharacterized protein